MAKQKLHATQFLGTIGQADLPPILVCYGKETVLEKSGFGSCS